MSVMNKDFIKFLCVGVLNTAVGLLIIFLLLNVAGLNYWLSTFIGNSTGAVVSYFLNKTFTFKSDVSNKEAMWKFAAVILACYAVSYSVSYLLFKLVNIEWISDAWIRDNLSALAGAGIYTLMNYFAQKYLVFKSKQKTNAIKQDP